jgi:hypothetical protein
MTDEKQVDAKKKTQKLIRDGGSGVSQKKTQRSTTKIEA